MNVLLRIIVCTALLLTAGCEPGRGYVQQEWSLTLRELGIVPVFPPKEDLYVADVYAYDYDPESAYVRRVFESDWAELTEHEQVLRQKIGMSPRFARLEGFNDLARETYAATPSFPSTLAGSENLLASSDATPAAERLTRAQTRQAAQVAAVADAKTAADNQATVVTNLAKEITDLEKVPTGETEAQRTVREEKLKLKTAEKAEADKKAAQLNTALATAKALLTLLQQETANAAAAHEAAQRNLASAPMFRQPSNSAADVFTAQPFTEPSPVEKSRVNRLRLVGFPDFAAASFSRGNLSALVPIEAFTLGLGLDASRVERVSVRIPAAESYGVALVDVLRINGSLLEDARNINAHLIKTAEDRAYARVAGILKTPPEAALSVLKETGAVLKKWPNPATTVDQEAARIAAAAVLLCKDPAPDAQAAVTRIVREELGHATRMLEWSAKRGNVGGTVLVNSLLTPLQLLHADRPGQDDCAYLRIPTEVFYARAIDISVFGASAGGGRLDLSTLGENGALRPTSGPASLGVDPNTATGAELLAAANASVGQTRTVPGGAIQFVSMSQTAIGLRRIYEKPVAIGFRGLTLKVDIHTGVIMDMAPSSGSTPSVNTEAPH